MDGLSLLNLIKYAAVLVAAIIIGNWFLAEARKAKTNKEPWYKPYAIRAGFNHTCCPEPAAHSLADR